MSGSIDKLTLKTGEMAIDEKYETNWCDMPPEMKRACIEKMNFHTRYQLSCTASEEREIVDSLKQIFESLYVCKDRFSMHDIPGDGYYIHRNIKEHDFYFGTFNFGPCNTSKMISILTFALKTCNFHGIILENCGLLDQIDWNTINTILKPKEVRIEDVNDNNDFNSTIKYLKKCWNIVDSIDIIAPNLVIPFEELFTIPSVITTRKMYLMNEASSNTSHQFIPLIEKWIENDAKIGTKLINRIFGYGQHYPIDELFEKFENRKISRQDSKMRIRTDNDGKHILMTRLKWGYDRFYCIVIPSNFEETGNDKYMHPYHN